MSLLVLVAVVGVVAFLLGKTWFVTIPVLIGLFVGGILLSSGGSIQDTPLPFVIALATIAAGSAIVLRRRITPI
jgi:uncharacterized protein YqhQ